MEVQLLTDVEIHGKSVWELYLCSPQKVRTVSRALQQHNVTNPVCNFHVQVKDWAYSLVG